MMTILIIKLILLEYYDRIFWLQLYCMFLLQVCRSTGLLSNSVGRKQNQMEYSL